MIKWLGRFFLVMTITGLIVSNVLTLTSAAFNAALSGALAAATGVQMVAGKVKARRAAGHKIGKRITQRTVRTAGRSLALVPGEMVPYLGVAVVVTAISLEVYAACENLNDMQELYATIGIEDSEKGKVEETCRRMQETVDEMKDRL